MKEFGFKSYEKLIHNCVFPVLDYCSTVWGDKKYQQLDNVQNRAIRYYLGVHRFAPVAAITGDVGWLASRYRRWSNMLRYWNRLISMENGRITKVIFEEDYRRCQNNWCSEIKHIMSALNILHCYNQKCTVNLQYVHSSLLNYQKQIWHETIDNSPKGVFIGEKPVSVSRTFHLFA
jgi:hypothetical protein